MAVVFYFIMIVVIGAVVDIVLNLFTPITPELISLLAAGVITTLVISAVLVEEDKISLPAFFVSSILAGMLLFIGITYMLSQKGVLGKISKETYPIVKIRPEENGFVIVYNQGGNLKTYKTDHLPADKNITKLVIEKVKYKQGLVTGIEKIKHVE
jgi:hypothetical protein